MSECNEARPQASSGRAHAQPKQRDCRHGARGAAALRGRQTYPKLLAFIYHETKDSQSFLPKGL